MKRYQKGLIVISIISPFLSYCLVVGIGLFIFWVSSGKIVLSDIYNVAFLIGNVIAINFCLLFYLKVRLENNGGNLP